MLTLIKEMSMASIIATAGQNNLFSKLWLMYLSVQALIPLETVFVVQFIVLLRRFVALYWQGSGLDVTLKRSMI